MSALQKILGVLLRPYTRRKARGLTLDQVIADLESSRDKIMPRILGAEDTAGNREALNHFIGIERWSANRVRVATGEVKLELDSNRRYRLPDDASLAELQAAFQEAREESLELACQIRASGTDTEIKVRHNDLGPLTVIEWLSYIQDHPAREIRRLSQVKAG